MFTAGQAPVTFRCRPRWWSIFPFSAPSARRWPALLPSLSAFPRLRGVGWGLSSLAASAALRCLFCGPFSSLLLMLSSRRRRRRVLSLSAVPSRWLRQPGPSFVLLFFPPLCGPFPSFGFSAALGLFSCCGPLAALRLCSCPRAGRRRRFLSFFPVSRVLPVLRPYGPLMAFLSAWLFLFFCSSLCCPPAARTFLSPSSFLRRMAALPVLPLFSFFCPVLRSLYWARPFLCMFLIFYFYLLF